MNGGFSRSGNSAAFTNLSVFAEVSKYGFDLIDNLLVIFGQIATTAMYSLIGQSK